MATKKAKPISKKKRKPKEVKPDSGAPSKYLPIYDKQAKELCLLGYTDVQLATFFDVCEATINNWKKDYPSFLESIKGGKDVADAKVAERLYERAMGFEHDSEEIKIIDNAVERVAVRKIYPPDPTAAIFWLKNRQPKVWRDRTESDNRNTNINSQQLTKEEIIEISKALENDC